MELILLIGIQASGKSTFCKEHFLDTHIRLNLDSLKTRFRENILFEACLRSKTKVVIDNTNSTVEERARYISKAKEQKFQVIGYFFIQNLELALDRNRNRVGKVPDTAIYGTSKRMEVPSPSEGFDTLFLVDSWSGQVQEPQTI